MKQEKDYFLLTLDETEEIAKEVIRLAKIVKTMHLANPDNPDFFSYGYIKSSYPIIHEEYHHIPSDLSRNEAEYERRKNYESVFMLDPDVFIEGTTFTDADHVVYSVGHMDNVSDENNDNID